MEKRFIAHIDYEFGKLQTCEEHCISVAKASERALSGIGLGKTAYLAGLLHDMGKFSEEFQAYIREGDSAKRGTVIHSFAGVRYMLTKFHDGKREYEDLASEIIAFAIGSHHGLFDITDGINNGFLHRINKQPDQDDKAAEAFHSVCTSTAEVRRLFNEAVNEVKEVYGSILNHVAGNYSSDSTDRNRMLLMYISLIVRLVCSAVIDSDRIDTAKFMGVETSDENDLINTWSDCSSFLKKRLRMFPSNTPISKARKSFSDSCYEFAGVHDSGIFRLDLPTGGGKTLSAFRFAVEHSKAKGKKRIIYVSPLLSIIDQNEKVIRSAVPNDNIVLAHHSNITFQNDAKGDFLESNELLKESWNSPIIITTLVRFLESLFSGSTGDVRRFKALSESVIILDEVQSVPRKMISIFNLVMNFLSICCNSTIILCSATQPTFENNKYPMEISSDSIIPDFLLRDTEPIFQRTEINYDGSMSLDDVCDTAKALLENSRSLLIVCNTKQEADSVFSALSGIDCERFFLSSALCMAHRKDVILKLSETLNTRESKVLCVSTQVIESGIDVSFASVIRLSAGLDNIVQAAGRCNRNGEMDSLGHVHVITLNNESLGPLQEISEGKGSFLSMAEERAKSPERFGRLDSKKSVACYYSFYLDDSAKPGFMEFPVGEGSYTILDLLSDNRRACGKDADSAKWFLVQAFRKAGDAFNVFDENSRTIIVPYGDGDKIIAELQQTEAAFVLGERFRLLKKAREYAVSIFDNLFDKLAKKGALYKIEYEDASEVFVLRPEYYDEFKGVTDKEVIFCRTEIL